MGSQQLNKAIIICGAICSGKSYTANLLSERINYPVASFGKYLKKYCEDHNLPTDRNTLQNVGEKFVETIPQQFLADVINHFIGNSSNMIIEGVRHSVIFNLITNLFKTTTAIFIETDDLTRYERYCFREKDSNDLITFEEFMLQNEHPVEIETQLLKPLCDITIDSTKPLDETIFNFLLNNSQN
jgi:dephospho-CoA kinase